MDNNARKELLKQLEQLRKEYCKQYPSMDILGFCHPKECVHRIDCPFNIYDVVGTSSLGWCSLCLLISCLENKMCSGNCDSIDRCKYSKNKNVNELRGK